MTVSCVPAGQRTTLNLLVESRNTKPPSSCRPLVPGCESCHACLSAALTTGSFRSTCGSTGMGSPVERFLSHDSYKLYQWSHHLSTRTRIARRSLPFHLSHRLAQVDVRNHGLCTFGQARPTSLRGAGCDAPDAKAPCALETLTLPCGGNEFACHAVPQTCSRSAPTADSMGGASDLALRGVSGQMV
jgi:hypothetical protein